MFAFLVGQIQIKSVHSLQGWLIHLYDGNGHNQPAPAQREIIDATHPLDIVCGGDSDRHSLASLFLDHDLGVAADMGIRGWWSE